MDTEGADAGPDPRTGSEAASDPCSPDPAPQSDQAPQQLKRRSDANAVRGLVVLPPDGADLPCVGAPMDPLEQVTGDEVFQPGPVRRDHGPVEVVGLALLLRRSGEADPDVGRRAWMDE